MSQRAIIHLDMDAFYASVEQRDDPRLRGKPVIVGGHPTRGVVLAASYEVRPFGVRSAMPMVQAVRLAPHAVVVPPRPRAYAQASDALAALMSEVTPEVEPLSLDEAFLDVTGSRALFGTAAQIAERLRRRVREELKLTASAGIANVKFVAKIASDLAKPDGQREVLAADTVGFLSGLPIGRLWGVGPKSEAELAGYGLRTIGDIARRGARWMQEVIGERGAHLWALSQGIDPRVVVSDRAAKSLSSEDTFSADISDLDALTTQVHAQALRVGRRLRRAGRRARVVQLKVKLADFTLVTRRQTLPEASDDGQLLFRVAASMLARVPTEQRVRLTGVSAQELEEETDQLALFPRTPSKRHELNRALDRIADKFGAAAVLTGDLLGRDDEAEVEDDDEARRRLGASR